MPCVEHCCTFRLTKGYCDERATEYKSQFGSHEMEEGSSDLNEQLRKASEREER